MTRLSRFLPLAFAASALSLALPAAAEDVTYRNERFGTTATFPSEAFETELPEPTNRDGKAWTSAEGAELFIYARDNRGGETPRSIIADRASDDDVTYRKSGDRWAVVSGYRDGKIFYERYIFRGGLVHSVAIRYPETLRERYDPLVGRITNTLKAGRPS